MLATPVITFITSSGTGLPSRVTPIWSGAQQLITPFTGLDSVSLTVWTAAVWVVGATFFASRLLLRWLRAEYLRRTGLTQVPEQIQSLANRIATRLGVRRTFRLVQSALTEVPAVIGWFRPVILIPVGLLERIPLVHVRALLAHELAHIKRNDYLVNLLQTIVDITLFYHPAAWWLSGRIREEREYCCDDIAASLSGDSLEYARALMELEDSRHRPAEPVIALTGGSLMNRVQRIVGNRHASRGSIAALLAIAITGIVVSTGVAAVVEKHSLVRGHNLSGAHELRELAVAQRNLKSHQGAIKKLRFNLQGLHNRVIDLRSGRSPIIIDDMEIAPIPPLPPDVDIFFLDDQDAVHDIRIDRDHAFSWKGRHPDSALHEIGLKMMTGSISIDDAIEKLKEPKKEKEEQQEKK